MHTQPRQSRSFGYGQFRVRLGCIETKMVHRGTSNTKVVPGVVGLGGAWAYLGGGGGRGGEGGGGGVGSKGAHQQNN